MLMKEALINWCEWSFNYFQALVNDNEALITPKAQVNANKAFISLKLELMWMRL